MSQPVEERIRRVENGLLPERPPDRRGEPGVALAERMEFHSVPGLSVAVINGFKVEWARGYGVRHTGKPAPVGVNTLFQAGSISKLVTAVGVLRLVQEGRLDLNEDVNTYLVSWKVPANGSWQPRVTLRQLLSHSAGTTVHGFPGYSRYEEVPSLVQVLNGEAPANTPPVFVNTVPGTQFRYSGGGTSIVQQLLIDVLGKPFPDIMRDLVLDPAGMKHSGFEQPLPRARWRSAATGHYWVKDDPVRGKWYIYPEMAAAGLWTTASDLARFAAELQQARRGRSAGTSHPSPILSEEIVEQMLTPQVGDNIGLGPFLWGAGDAASFGHDGDDHGFVANLTAFKVGGYGVAILANSYGAGPLIEELRSAVAQEYAWPHYAPESRTPAEVRPGVYDAYAGEYELKPGLRWAVTRVDDSLWLRTTGQEPMALCPKSEVEFYLSAVNAEVSFVTAEGGRVEKLIFRQNYQEMPAKKV
jgi:CubicO group peptidase (beta-lactamase class C family)